MISTEENKKPSLRELRATKLGQVWAENPAYKHELDRFAEWRACVRENEWERQFCSGEEQFQAIAVGAIETIMPDIATPDFAWECWYEWLQLENAEEAQPEEVRAFLDAAFEVWEQQDMANW